MEAVNVVGKLTAIKLSTILDFLGKPLHFWQLGVLFNCSKVEMGVS